MRIENVHNNNLKLNSIKIALFRNTHSRSSSSLLPYLLLTLIRRVKAVMTHCRRSVYCNICLCNLIGHAVRSTWSLLVELSQTSQWLSYQTKWDFKEIRFPAHNQVNSTPSTSLAKLIYLLTWFFIPWDRGPSSDGGLAANGCGSFAG